MSKFQLAADAADILAGLKVPVERAAFLRKYAAQKGVGEERAAAVWDALEQAGLLSNVAATEQPHDYMAGFADWRIQRSMLADTARVMAFEKAIKAVVRPGDVVIDVGAGSGILSLLAARAGAAKVYALEATPLARQAQAVADANGFAGRIQFIEGDAAQFVSPQPADLVMGEWAGMYLVEEWRHFDAFARVRDTHLKRGGKVLPQKARLYLSPLDDSRLYTWRGPGFWERPVYGFDFSLVHKQQQDRTRRSIVQAAKQTLLKPVEILSVDCASADSRAFFFEHEFEHAFTHDATCHGFLGFFELELAPGVVLDTSPYSLDNSWHQSYFPMEQIAIRAGDTLVVSVKSAPDEFIASPVLTIRAELMRGGKPAALQERVYTLEDTQG